MAHQPLWLAVPVTQSRKDKSHAHFRVDYAEKNVPYQIILKDECRTIEFYVTKEDTRGKKTLFSLPEQTETQNME